MKAQVSIIMGSTSDWPIMQKTAAFLNNIEIPFEINALSSHRAPEQVEHFAKNAQNNGIKVIIAAMTPLPVLGVPIKASLYGLDSLLTIVQMPPDIPVATVGINRALNAGILATQVIGSGDSVVFNKTIEYIKSLKKKNQNANEN